MRSFIKGGGSNLVFSATFHKHLGDTLGNLNDFKAVRKIDFNSKAKNKRAKNDVNKKLEDCVYCGKTFSHDIFLKHKAEEEKCLKCQYCDQDFENVHLFRRHTYRYHKYYSCKICKKRFLKGAYEYHMSSFHRAKPECRICNKAFATKLSLVAHEKKIHLGERHKRFQCQICQYDAPDKYQFKIHTARHNKSPFLICDYCGIGHYTKTELNKHIQADHYGGYPCAECQKTFRSPEYLKRHMTVHNANEGAGNFTCEECGKGFSNKSTFSRHCLVHKNQLLIYKCDLCGKSTSSKGSLKAHMKIHSKQIHL